MMKRCLTENVLGCIVSFVLLCRATLSEPCGAASINFSISTVEEAQSLRDGLLCSGRGTFQAEWSGNVNIGSLLKGFEVGNASSLTVKGMGGGAVVSGAGLIALFSVSGGSSLYIESISLENGVGQSCNVSVEPPYYSWTDYDYSSCGGAVYAKDGAVISAVDCAFVNNSAGFGGAIFVSNSSKVSLEGRTSMTNNSASNGGAIYAGEDAVVVCNGTNDLEHNAANDGGAMFVSSSATVSLEGRTLMTRNRAGSGGAIYVQDRAIVICSGKNDISQNLATSSGGAANLEGGSLVLLGDTSLTGNFAQFWGGAIRATWYTGSKTAAFFQLPQANVTIAGNASMANNKAENGGAVYSNHGDITLDADVSFANNTASQYFDWPFNDTYDGGAIYARDSVLEFRRKTYFVNNSADQGGGVSLTGRISVNFDGEMEWIDNSATYNGGGLYMGSINAVTNFSGNSKWARNSAGRLGGALYMDTDFNPIFHGATVWTGNYAGEDGGAFYLDYSNAKNGEMIFNGESKWSNNSAGANGGALYTEEGIVFNNKSMWSFNLAEENGGALYVDNAGTVTLNGESVWSHNIAGGYGGAVYTDDFGEVYIIGEATFESNTAASGEGDDTYGVEAHNSGVPIVTKYAVLGLRLLATVVAVAVSLEILPEVMLN